MKARKLFFIVVNRNGKCEIFTVVFSKSSLKKLFTQNYIQYNYN